MIPTVTVSALASIVNLRCNRLLCSLPIRNLAYLIISLQSEPKETDIPIIKFSYIQNFLTFSFQKLTFSFTAYRDGKNSCLASTIFVQRKYFE